MPEMDAPGALVFRPLVKGNEALGTRLLSLTPLLAFVQSGLEDTGDGNLSSAAR